MNAQQQWVPVFTSGSHIKAEDRPLSAPLDGAAQARIQVQSVEQTCSKTPSTPESAPTSSIRCICKPAQALKQVLLVSMALTASFYRCARSHQLSILTRRPSSSRVVLTTTTTWLHLPGCALMTSLASTCSVRTTVAISMSLIWKRNMIVFGSSLGKADSITQRSTGPRELRLYGLDGVIWGIGTRPTVVRSQHQDSNLIHVRAFSTCIVHR